jgi:hypothetical protein
LTRRANHRHIFIIAANLSPRRETGRGLFQSHFCKLAGSRIGAPIFLRSALSQRSGGLLVIDEVLVLFHYLKVLLWTPAARTSLCLCKKYPELIGDRWGKTPQGNGKNWRRRRQTYVTLRRTHRTGSRISK